jgi:hypothetical protein
MPGPLKDTRTKDPVMRWCLCVAVHPDHDRKDSGDPGREMKVAMFCVHMLAAVRCSS